VEELRLDQHRVTAIAETLEKTNLSGWKEGSIINIERCLLLSSRLDGHIVQGHVDTTAVCSNIKEKKGSWEIEFQFPKKFAPLIVEKGSIAVDGISLTAFDVKRRSFRVAIVPFTYEHTSVSELKAGHTVNLEFDMVGKYLLRSLSLR
jgi:riboflavin synthase